MAVIEELHVAGAAAGFQAAVFTTLISCPHIIASANQELIDRYVRPALAGDSIGSLSITEPGGGSDVGGPRTTAKRWDEGETDLVTEACFAKNPATETGQWVTHQAVQLFGGAGFMHGTEVERQYRDMRINGIGGGTVEILTELAARRLGYTA